MIQNSIKNLSLWLTDNLENKYFGNKEDNPNN